MARIQALEISDRRWEYDVEQLLAQLEGVMREDSEPVAPVEPSPPPPAEPVPVSAPTAPPVPEVFPGVRTSAGGPAEAASANAYAIASLVLGVASVVTGILGLPFGIAALATGVRGRRSLKPAYATAGMITGALGSVISIVVLLLIFVLWATSPKQ